MKYIAPFYTIDLTVRWMVPFYKKELTAIFFAMFKAAAIPPTKKPLLEVAFISDTKMTQLNLQSTGCSGPTNVLSFPMNSQSFLDTRKIIPQLGLLAIAPSTVLRECFLYGQSPTVHFIRLFSHGIAHLLGFDHGNAMNSLCGTLEASATCL